MIGIGGLLFLTIALGGLFITPMDDTSDSEPEIETNGDFETTVTQVDDTNTNDTDTNTPDSEETDNVTTQEEEEIEERPSEPTSSVTAQHGIAMDSLNERTYADGHLTGDNVDSDRVEPNVAIVTYEITNEAEYDALIDVTTKISDGSDDPVHAHNEYIYFPAEQTTTVTYTMDFNDGTMTIEYGDAEPKNDSIDILTEDTIDSADDDTDSDATVTDES